MSAASSSATIQVTHYQTKLSADKGREKFTMLAGFLGELGVSPGNA
jgi:hypothetical protein